jgi:hypothetical protein
MRLYLVMVEFYFKFWFLVDSIPFFTLVYGDSNLSILLEDFDLLIMFETRDFLCWFSDLDLSFVDYFTKIYSVDL